MRLVTHRVDAAWRLGLERDDVVIDVEGASAEVFAEALPGSVVDLLAAGERTQDRLRALADPDLDVAHHARPVSGVRIGPPVPTPGKILCVGLNYRRHAHESGLAEPAEPVLFSKFGNTVVGTDAEVSIAGLTHVDYEAELAFVIGRTCKNVSETDALSHVFGYLNANDLSDRHLQNVSGQWLLGKTPDGFLPTGPRIVTADEVSDPQALRVRGWLNGELRQDSSTADMIFSVAEIVAYASRYMTLEPGDVVCTGTPEGVILGHEDRVWMRPGDEYTVEIGSLGRLTTKVVG